MIVNQGIKYNPIYFYGGKNELPDNHDFTLLANTTEDSFDWQGVINEDRAITFGDNSITRQALIPCSFNLALGEYFIISAYVKMDDDLAPFTSGSPSDFQFRYNTIARYIPNQEHLGNNIYRVWITSSIASGATISSISVYKNISNSSARSFKIYGLQVERAKQSTDLPTEYTPTTGTALSLGKSKPFTVIRGNTIYGKKRFLYDTGMIFAKATEKNFTMPDLREKLLINDFIKNEIRSGKWHEQDLYGHFAYNAPELVDFARINWRNPFGTGTIENICTQSDNFADADWQVSSSIIKIPNTAETQDPKGTYTACKIQTIPGQPSYTAIKSGLVCNNTTLTYSLYVKAGSAATQCVISLRDVTSSTNKAVGFYDNTNGSYTVTVGTGAYRNVGNGWLRLEITATNCVVGNTYAIYYSRSGNSIDNGTWYVWGPQVENNSYASDYIPTGATTAKGDNLFLLYGGLTYGAYGFLPNGIDAYIDTQFNPATMGKKYTLNNAGRGAVVFNDGSGSIAARFIDGNTQDVYANKLFAYNTNTHRINQSGNNLNVTVDLSGNGYKDIMRTTNVDVVLRNKDVETAATANSTAIANYNQLLFNARAQYSNVGISAYSISAALTYAQSQAHRANVNKLLAGFGLNPIA